MEIQTESQYTNPEDCKLVVREMQEMLSTLGVSEADISKSQMRVDVSLSIHDKNTLLKTPLIEIKGIPENARNVQRAIEYEYRRLVAMLESGKNTQTQTRRFDSKSGKTVLLRMNPEKPDYRFF